MTDAYDLAVEKFGLAKDRHGSGWTWDVKVPGPVRGGPFVRHRQETQRQIVGSLSVPA